MCLLCIYINYMMIPVIYFYFCYSFTLLSINLNDTKVMICQKVKYNFIKSRRCKAHTDCARVQAQLMH